MPITVRHLHAAVLASLLAACGAPGADELAAGRRALGRADYAEAIARFTEVTLEAPGTPAAARALYEIGAIHYLELRDLDAARAAFRKLLSDYPDSAEAREARRMLARMYDLDLDEPDKALEEYERLLRDAAGPREAKQLRLAMADCLYRRDAFEEAARAYRLALRAGPYEEETDGPVTLRLAHLESLLGRPEDAIRLYESLLARSREPETRRRAHIALAELLVALGRYERAAVGLAAAEAEFPGDPDLAAIAARREAAVGTEAGEAERLEERIPWSGRARRRR